VNLVTYNIRNENCIFLILWLVPFIRISRRVVFGNHAFYLWFVVCLLPQVILSFHKFAWQKKNTEHISWPSDESIDQILSPNQIQDIEFLYVSEREGKTHQNIWKWGVGEGVLHRNCPSLNFPKAFIRLCQPLLPPFVVILRLTLFDVVISCARIASFLRWAGILWKETLGSKLHILFSKLYIHVKDSAASSSTGRKCTL
jgi:hypothetical protein